VVRSSADGDTLPLDAGVNGPGLAAFQAPESVLHCPHMA